MRICAVIGLLLVSCTTNKYSSFNIEFGESGYHKDTMSLWLNNILIYDKILLSPSSEYPSSRIEPYFIIKPPKTQYLMVRSDFYDTIVYFNMYDSKKLKIDVTINKLHKDTMIELKKKRNNININYRDSIIIYNTHKKRLIID